MRKILFRGKRKDNGEWVQGYYVSFAGRTHYIYSGRYSDYDAVRYDVDKETVSEFSGLKDKNGKRIFEGDIIKKEKSDEIHEIVFYKGKFVGRHTAFGKEYYCIFFTKENDSSVKLIMKTYEVIGNRYDNPEIIP